MSGSTNIFESIKGKALLAPMLATTDIPFRTICREYGAAMTFTEMVSAAGIMRSSSVSFRNAVFSEAERPVAIQLVAATADAAAYAVRELSGLRPDAFDLNCGCPNDRICEVGAGADLLDDLPRLGAIVEATVRASSVPISVKVRMRGSGRQTDITDIVRAVEQSGASCVAIHTRTKNTPYSTAAVWDSLSAAVASTNIPVIGNGDIFSAADAIRMINETGCAAVMVARGCLGTPWIFADIKSGNAVGILASAPDAQELYDLVSRHVRFLYREFGDMRAVTRMRKHSLWYARFHEDWDTLRRNIFAVEDARMIMEIVEAFFAAEPRRLAPESPEALRIEAAFRDRVLYWTTETVNTEG